MMNRAETINEVCGLLRKAEGDLRLSRWAKDESGYWKPVSLDHASSILAHATDLIVSLASNEWYERNTTEG